MALPLKTALLAACGLVWLGLAPGPALAGRVALEVSAQAAVSPQGFLEVRATLRNNGEEPVGDLRATALNLPGLAPASSPDILAPGQSAEMVLAGAVSPPLPGRHAVVLRLDMLERGQHHLSALGYAYYQAGGGEGGGRLEARAEPAELRRSGNLALRLVNSGPTPLRAELKIYTPRELAVLQPPAEVELAAGQEREVLLEVTNLSGQPRAQYPLLILTAHQDDGRRHETVSEVKLTLAPQDNVFRRHLAWWLGGIALLAAWMAWRQARAGRR